MKRGARSVLKKDPQTRPNQVLPQIATPIGVDLSAGIIEVVILDEGAELRCPIVVSACDDLPCNVRATLPSAAVKGVAGSGDVDVRRFRIVDADPGPAYGWNLLDANLRRRGI
jgi:hypothetical protein